MRLFKECDDTAFWTDPSEGFRRLFAAGERVLRAPDAAFCVFGHRELIALAREPTVEGVPVAADAFGEHTQLAALYGAGLFAGAGPSHRYARRAALAGLGVAPVALRATEIEALVERALSGCPVGTPFDLAQDLIAPLTARIWARLAGYPADAETALAQAVAILADPDADLVSQAAAAGRVRELTITAWQSGASPFMRAIADALPSGSACEPAPLVASMAVDGIDSAAAGLAGALAILAHQPPDTVARFGVEACLQEALRLAMPVILSMRRATQDVSCGEVGFPRGTILWMWWGAGCVDPRAYPAPNRFLPGRGGPRAPVFGAGAHACLGHVLIRTAALPLISGAFGGMGQLVAAGPASPSQPWRLSRLPRQTVLWRARSQA